MAAYDFPDAPSIGTVYDKWTWNGNVWVFTTGTGAGYTFTQEFTPVPTKIGDTWFDTSTGATGGTSWVAIEEAPGGEKVWVQTSPGSGNPNALPWNSAWGKVIDTAWNTAQNSVITAVDVTGSACTFTWTYGRKLRVAWANQVYTTGGLIGHYALYVNNVQLLDQVFQTGGAWWFPIAAQFDIDSTATSMTVKNVASSNGTAMSLSPSSFAFLSVVDIGPINRT